MFTKRLVLSLASVLTKVVPLISMEVCTTKNISCTDIKDNAGHFCFRYATPRATEEIEINENGTPLVLGKFGSLSLSSDVVHCDDKSIIRKTCRNFYVKFIEEQGGRISESCLIFNTIEDKQPVYSSPDWKPIVGAVLGVVVLVVIICIGCYWKRKRVKKWCGFPVCALERDGTSITEGRREEQRAAQDNRLNALQEQEESLLPGKSRECNGGMDILINMDNMTATNEDKGVPQAIGALPHEVQNGNLRHDPGGGAADTRLHGNKSCLTGWTLAEQSPGSDKDKEQQSPRSQGSAGPGCFAGEEGRALVDSLDPGNGNTPLPNEEKGGNVEDNMY